MSIFSKVGDIFRGTGLNPGDGATEQTARTRRNIAALAGIDGGDANKQHIAARARKRQEAIRLAAKMLRDTRADSQHAATLIELYIDDWVFHHGYAPKVGSPEFVEMIADVCDRAVKHVQTIQKQREDEEFRAMRGSLADSWPSGW